MKFLKPHNRYPETMSISKELFRNKKFMVRIQEYYNPHYLAISFWMKDKDINMFYCKKSFHISLSLYAFYISHIYHHLGICHKSLRSKFYIGTPIEKRKEVV